MQSTPKATPIYQTCKRCGSQIEQTGDYKDTNLAVQYSRGSSNLNDHYFRICRHVESRPSIEGKPCLYKVCKMAGSLQAKEQLDKDSHLNEFNPKEK